MSLRSKHPSTTFLGTLQRSLQVNGGKQTMESFTLNSSRFFCMLTLKSPKLLLEACFQNNSEFFSLKKLKKGRSSSSVVPYFVFSTKRPKARYAKLKNFLSSSRTTAPLAFFKYVASSLKTADSVDNTSLSLKDVFSKKATSHYRWWL